MQITKQVTEKPEAYLCDANNLLIVLSTLENGALLEGFYGAKLMLDDLSPALPCLAQKTVYLCGDISQANRHNFDAADRVLIIRELSHSYDAGTSQTWELIDLGQVPINIHGLGVYYRRFFNLGLDHFNQICAEHRFQSLTESTKPGTAHRTGLYLTPVEQDGEALHFRLLRCSTNLSGPTENFRAIDHCIVDALNQEATRIFRNQASLNHVLAQIYHNTPANAVQKQSKAKISAHADKTKDMPANGIMAFCTFYDQLDKLQPLTTDDFDYGHKETSGLTWLYFRLKEPDVEHPESPFPSQFTVTLYPNSVFLMPLSTNRLYTHEIRSSMLDAELLPTRLGYVVRCSGTEAVHQNGQTLLKLAGQQVALIPPTPEGIAELRKLYAQENKTQALVDYGDRFLFSMNAGDYHAPKSKLPMSKVRDMVRLYTLPTEDNLFEELFTSTRFENVGKGRQGAVLLKVDETACIPIVRTTTQYRAPAQCFRPVHEQLAQQIQHIASLSVGFNNALLEHYTNAYTTMGIHSDQALDLAEESFIAIFSCYQYPELTNPLRVLRVESKESDGDRAQIPLTHNSVVLFSVATNRRLKHKIMLDKSGLSPKHPCPENPWLGITYRTSKTFIRFSDEDAYFLDDVPLTLANDAEKREFYGLRHQENQQTNFSYPRITYTLSESDMMPPEPIEQTDFAK